MGVMMNIGLILPARSESHKHSGFIYRMLNGLNTLFPIGLRLETQHIELVEGITLVVCPLPMTCDEIKSHEGLLKKVRNKLEMTFDAERAWPVLEHPEVKGIFNPHDFYFEQAITEVAIDRFPEVLKLLSGIGELSTREVTVTGGSSYLEYAISKLITKVKVLNLLLPEGSCEPGEAELAFEETGIPVHITTDPEVLNRTAVWLRFPDDDAVFDVLPETYHGMIADLGAMKIIDTKNKKIYSITLEFSDRIKRRIGHNNLRGWEKGVLEGMLVTVCANAWDMSVTDASLKLAMRISFKS